MKEQASSTSTQQDIVMEFLRRVAAKPSKRYPVFVWKVTSIYPNDMLEIFLRWQEQSKYQGVCLFRKEKHFFDALYTAFDSFGLHWSMKTSYKREKLYFGNLRLKENGCRLLMEVGAKTYIAD